MLAKEFDYGLRKYRPVFLVTIVLILLFYRGVGDQPTGGDGVTIGYRGPVSTATLPGVTWVEVPQGTAPAVFDGGRWIDAFVVAEGRNVDVFIHPGTLKETDVYMAVDSLRYEHTYLLRTVASSRAAATSESATVEHMAIGFILTFLCLYLPFFSWKLERDTFWQQVQSPASDHTMLTSKSIVIGFLVLVAWVFYWFLFSPGVQGLVLLAMASFVIMGLGMALGIWRRRRWANGVLYLLLLVLLFLPSAEGVLGLLPDSPYLLAAGLAVGMAGSGALALWSLRARIAGERAR